MHSTARKPVYLKINSKNELKDRDVAIINDIYDAY